MRFRYVRESKREREIATNKMNARERREEIEALSSNQHVYVITIIYVYIYTHI